MIPLREHLGLASSELPLIAVQDGGHCWILQPDARTYRHADRGTLWATCRDSWPDSDAEFLSAATKNGRRRLTPDDLIEAHAAKIDGYELDHTIDAPRLRDQILAVPPKRRTLPEAHEQASVAAWLAALHGPDLARVCDWIACSGVERLDSFLPALALVGPPGCGKSVLAHAIAVTHGQSSAMDVAALMGDFNDGADQCSVFNADEKTEHDSRGLPRTREFRKRITERERRINPKGRPAFVVRGAVRLVFSANRFAAIFPNVGDLSAADVDAIAERFLYVEIPERRATAARVLIDAIGADDSDRLRVLAEHFRWLQVARAVARPAGGARFMVATEPAALAGKLGRASMGVEKILAALEIPGQVARHNDLLLVSPKRLGAALADHRLTIEAIGSVVREHLGQRDARGEVVAPRVRNLWGVDRACAIALDLARLRALAGPEVAAEIEAGAHAA